MTKAKLKTPPILRHSAGREEKTTAPFAYSIVLEVTGDFAL